MTRPSTNICLNMIVKNETSVLPRLFRSLKDYIDYYVIVDTGSTDRTIALIAEEMARYNIDGEVHEREWVNFGVNRQQALELAVQAKRADWLLFIDADEELGVSDPHFFATLQKGVTYTLEKHHSGMRYAVPHLINVAEAQWKWEGPVHNYLVQLGGSKKRVLRKDVWIKYHPGQGAKSRGVTSEQKYLRDAKLLEEHLQAEPTNARSQFYLGQSYKHAGHLEKAKAAYQKRVLMEGWAEERFMAQLEVGRVAILRDEPEAAVLEALLAAFEMRPTRAEPLHALATYFRARKQYGKAYLFATLGASMPKPEDSLFVAQDIYDWRLLDEAGVAAYWVGNAAASKSACDELLRRVAGGLAVPDADLERVRKNLAFAVAKLAPKASS